MYFSSGAPTACTYSLGSTVNAGTAKRLAYFSGANAVSATGFAAYDEIDSTASTPVTRRILHLFGPGVGNTAAELISGTAGLLSYGDGGPQINFNTASSLTIGGGQDGALIFTDHDTAGAGVSWHFVSNQGDWNVISKRFHARTSISIGTDLPNTSYNLYVNGTTNITGNTTIGGTLGVTGAITQNGNQVLHAGNYTSYTYSSTASRTANYVLAAPNGSAGAATFRKLVAADLPSHTHAYTVPQAITIQTGSTKQSHITLQTLMTWLITTKGYITSNTERSLILATSWQYSDNDILQLSIDGTNYELQLAGVIIEFHGKATDYQSGRFRLRIHSSPTASFTANSGYTIFPTSHIAEYTCNGSSYYPTWKMLIDRADISNGTSTTSMG